LRFKLLISKKPAGTLSTCIRVTEQELPKGLRFTPIALVYNSPETNGGFGLLLGM
jgi:hypothetical protein